MAKRYGHIGHSARREAVNKISISTVFSPILGFNAEGSKYDSSTPLHRVPDQIRDGPDLAA